MHSPWRAKSEELSAAAVVLLVSLLWMQRCARQVPVE
jgi:hypothetical protein